MRKKYFFFDVDGTLTKAAKDPTIPKETFAALDALRANGHFLAIATGRAFCMAQFAMASTGIDNMICDGGNGFCLDGKIVDIEPMDREKSITICKEAMAKKLPFAVVDGDCLEYHSPDDQFLRIAGETLANLKATIHPDFDPNKIKKFHKIFFALPEERECEIENRHLLPYMRYHENAFVFEPADKFKGIVRMMAYLQAPLEDVVVFGDGKNDLDMFEKAPFSIAMGNAIEPLKAIASYVTDRSDNDGIGKACRHFGWIE